MIQWSQLGTVETSIIGILAGIIWIVYSFVILQRKSLKDRFLRSVLFAFALFCLCLIIYKPQYSVSRPGGKALLLTQDVKSVPDSITVFALPQVNTPFSITKVPDLAFIERNYPEINELYIDGYDLEPEQIRSLKRIKLTFVEKKSPAGFNWLTYTRQVKEGEDLIVSGTYVNNQTDTLKLLFSTPAGLQDSVWLPSGVNRFSLQANTQIPGMYTATVQVVGADSTRSERLPYVVHPQKPLGIVMLQDFPSFEMNYLKDWLTKGKHHIQVKTRISRNKYATQNINQEKNTSPKSIVAQENLSRTDLLISDTESLRQLSTIEKTRVQEAIEQGLGLIVLGNEEWVKNPKILGKEFPISPSSISSFAPQQAKSAYQEIGMVDKLPASFLEKALLVPVAYSQAEELITAYLPDGKGRIGVQLATATFPWILQGKENIYSSFWTDIIKIISRRQLATDISVEPLPFVLKDQPAKFTIRDTVLIPATITYTSGIHQTAMPEKALQQPFGTAYQFLPVEEGWIKMGYREDTTHYQYTYVLPSNAWADLKQVYWWQQRQKTSSTYTAANTYTFNAWEVIPLIWLFLPLLGSLGFLWWLEKK